MPAIKPKAKSSSSTAKPGTKNAQFSFSKFLQDPMVAGALLVVAFVALMFALNQFVAARGF